MVAQISPDTTTEIIYPDCDGQPMSDNTKQFRWIVTIKENLEILFAEHPDVFIAGDLLWYPVEGNNKIRFAPDAMVVFGRPKGDRGSYRQWVEGGIAPQVVFEILSPGNRMAEMSRKLHFYEQYGVEEYYIYDPDRIDFTGWIRNGDRLIAIEDGDNLISPRLGIRFEMQPDTLKIYYPDNRLFSSFVELDLLRQEAQQQLQQSERQLEQSERQLEQSQQQLEQSQQQAEKLAAKLRELGIDPTSL